jgi:hypothetical protein
VTEISVSAATFDELKAIQKAGGVVTLSREAQVELGMVKPGPTEQEKREAQYRAWQEKKARAREEWPAVLAALDAVTDPIVRSILDLHQRQAVGGWHGRRTEYECHGCDSCCLTPSWPCSTTEKIIEQLGLTAPELGLEPAEDGSTDYKEPTP